MNRHVRIRCPICGMLGWQSRFAKEFDFEVVIHEIGSKGRGRITNKYYPPEHQDGVWILKLAMIKKMEAALEKLREEVGEERDAAYHEKLHAGEYVKALSTLGKSYADFSIYSSLVFDDGIEVFRTPSVVAIPGQPVYILAPGDQSAVQIVPVKTEAELEEGIVGAKMPSQAMRFHPRPRPPILALSRLIERRSDVKTSGVMAEESDIVTSRSSVLEEVTEDEEWTKSNSEIQTEQDREI